MTMALYKGKKALYEAIITKKAEQAQAKVAKMPERQAAPRPNSTAASGLFSWPKKPKAVQHANGRIEMSFSVPIMGAVALAVLVILLVVFQVGKFSGKHQPIATSAVSTVSTQPTVSPARQTAADVAVPAKQTKVEAVKTETVKSAADGANKGNWIVIQQYQVSRDLEPVRDYFHNNGIETKIISRMSRGRQMYFLVSADLFENTGKAGSDGYQMIQKIRKVGAGYKAPQNYESFAPHLFGDAYGEKVSQ
jgi:hypothetical protein